MRRISAACTSFKLCFATRPMTSTRSSSRLLMAVLVNETSSGGRGDLLVYGDISNEAERGHYQRGFDQRFQLTKRLPSAYLCAAGFWIKGAGTQLTCRVRLCVFEGNKPA